VVEDVFAKFADGQRVDRLERLLVPAFIDKLRNVVFDQRLAGDCVEGQVGDRCFGGNPFAFRARGDTSQLVAGLLLICLGEDLAEIGKMKALGHRSRAPLRRLVRRDGRKYIHQNALTLASTANLLPLRSRVRTWSSPGLP